MCFSTLHVTFLQKRRYSKGSFTLSSPSSHFTPLWTQQPQRWKYLGNDFDNSLTFQQHLELQKLKIKWVSNIRGSFCVSWGSWCNTAALFYGDPLYSPPCSFIRITALRFLTGDKYCLCTVDSSHLVVTDNSKNTTLLFIKVCDRSRLTFKHLKPQQRLESEHGPIRGRRVSSHFLISKLLNCDWMYRWFKLE